MNISEDFSPENEELSNRGVNRPPVLINELPEPQIFPDGEEEKVELYLSTS